MTEIVVKIPEDLHETIINPDKWLTPKRVNALVGAVLHGKVLPKGHGKISDLDKFETNFNEKCCGECGCCSYSYEYDRCGLFKDAEVLVEEDKGEEDANN